MCEVIDLVIYLNTNYKKFQDSDIYQQNKVHLSAFIFQLEVKNAVQSTNSQSNNVLHSL